MPSWPWLSRTSRSKQLRYSLIQRSLSTASASAATSITLRPYQENCLAACIDALTAGKTRIGVSLPTGAGKTTVFINLLSRMQSPNSNSNATRSLIIVNSVELAMQSAQQAKALCPHWKVEIEQGAKHVASGSADVTIATYQSLASPGRMRKFEPRYLKAIIVDEAHHAAAPSYRRLLAQLNSEIKHPDADFEPSLVTPSSVPIIGFSATFSRHDGLALGSVFEHIVYHRDFIEMIKEQWLCDVRFTSVQANIDLSSVTVSSATGDFNPTSLAEVIDTDTINRLVVQSWLEKAATRKSTLVFCVNIAHVRNLTETFRAFGIDARALDSRTAAIERRTLISSFRAGEYPILINCAILTEGADIPNIDCVIVARPTRSRNVFAQMIGRGMRQSPSTNKVDCRIIDFVGSVGRINGVISAPTLFGLDPGEMDMEDMTVEDLEQLASLEFARTADLPDPKSVTYTDHDDPFSLVDQSSGAPHVQKLSPNAWVGCGQEIYVLECMGKGHVRIELVPKTDEEEEHYHAHYTATMDRSTAAALKISPYLNNRKILTATLLEDAIKGCDTYVKNQVVRGGMVLGLLRTAAWRKKPASDQQKAFVGKRWGKRGSADEAKLNETRLANMTKGEAANIISRLKHGAQGRHAKAIKQGTRMQKASDKEKERKSRHSVKVGPLL